jgi:NADH-quinone oxidoreductase subunit M
MHNRVGPKVTSFEIKRWEAVAIVPMVLLILVFAFYPQFALKRSQSSIRATVAAANGRVGYFSYPPLSTSASTIKTK